MYMYMHMYMYMYMNVCIYVYIYIYVYECIYIMYIYIYVYECMYTLDYNRIEHKSDDVDIINNRILEFLSVLLITVRI